MVDEMVDEMVVYWAEKKVALLVAMMAVNSAAY